MRGTSWGKVAGPGVKARYYLIVRPAALEPREIEADLKALSEMTGLDRLTLRQKLTGDALQVLMHASDPTSLEELSEQLRERGIPAGVLGKEELEERVEPRRAAGVEIHGDRLDLLDPQGERLCSLDPETAVLMVLSCTRIRGLRSKRVARLVLSRSGTVPLQQMLDFIFRNHPVMDLYLSGGRAPIRVDGLRFNYRTLGDRNRQAVALNFPVLIGLIRDASRRVVLDTGFGGSELPFVDLSEEKSPERVLREFTAYSGFVSLAYGKGLLSADGEGGAPQAVPLLQGLEGLLWAGPLGTPSGEGSRDSETPAAPVPPRRAEGADVPPPPPEGTLEFAPMDLRTWPAGFSLYAAKYKKWVRVLGPPALIYPLSTVLFGLLALAYMTRRPWFPAAALTVLGVLFFIHAFVVLHRKRDIENCPTSRIRSLPMGLVEIKGVARQKYALKAPYSFTDCVYYSYRVYEWVHTSNGSTYRLKRWGESGRIPFYLEDETGRVLVLPQEAVIKAGISQDVSRSFLEVLGGPSPWGEGVRSRVVETVIPEGKSLYVMGFARPLRTATGERRKAYVERLRELKRDPARLRGYDRDGDGRISEEEWDAVRQEIGERALLEEAGGAADRVAIGAHPTGGLFYVSDRHEEVLTRSMAWRIPLFLVLGMAGVVGGLFVLSVLI